MGDFLGDPARAAGAVALDKVVALDAAPKLVMVLLLMKLVALVA